MTQPRAVAREDGFGWHVYLGRERIGGWACATAELTAEAAAKRYAARVNAELDGGVLAFGCEKESRKKLPHCLTWCGSSGCPMSLSSSDHDK
jgi:hypothetical protein